MKTFPRTRRAYPSDVSDAQWRRIEPLFPQAKPRGRHREIDLREVVNAIHYRWTTGCVWRMLPHDFPAWGTVYTYFRNWQRDETLRRLRDQLLKPKLRMRGHIHSGSLACSHNSQVAVLAHDANRSEHRWDCEDPEHREEPCRDNERAA